MHLLCLHWPGRSTRPVCSSLALQDNRIGLGLVHQQFGQLGQNRMYSQCFWEDSNAKFHLKPVCHQVFLLL